MKRIALVLGLLATAVPFHARGEPDDFRSEPPATPAAAPFVPPPIREARLANGIRVLLVERHELPIVTVRAVSSFGASQVPSGLAALATEAATRATGDDDDFKLDKAFSSIAAEHDARVTMDGTELSVKCLTPRLPRAIELIAAIAYDPAFARDDLAATRARRQRLRTDAARKTTSLLMANALYPALHPRHDDPWGSEAMLATTSTDALRTFWRTAWAPARTTIVVAGDTRMEELRPLLESAFGREKAAGTPSVVAPLPAPLAGPRAEIVLAHRAGLAQSQITVAAVVPGASSPDYDALAVLSELLAGRLHGDLRERRALTYDVDVSLDPLASQAELSIETAVETNRTGEALTHILAELDRLGREPVDDDFLARAKKNVEGRLPAYLETTDGTSTALARLALAGESVDAWAARRRRVDALTAESVRRVASQYVASSRMRIVLAGDAQRVQAQLGVAGLGAARVVR